MCLTNIDPKPKRKYGIGYKSVKKLANGTYTCEDYMPLAGTVVYPLNKWLTDPKDGDAKTGSPYPEYKPKYKTGFHIMLNDIRSKSLTGVTIKVRFRKVTATQIDNPDSLYGRQVVAREIMNLGEV